MVEPDGILNDDRRKSMAFMEIPGVVSSNNYRLDTLNLSVPSMAKVSLGQQRDCLRTCLMRLRIPVALYARAAARWRRFALRLRIS